jgi:hypothetical protein
MTDERDLYGLLGLPHDTDIAHLRYVYEQHVADAVRSRNTARALQLSRAFDALGGDARRAMYSGAGTRTPRFAAMEPRPRVQARQRSDRHAVPDQDNWRYGLLPRPRFVVALVGVPLAFIGTVALLSPHALDPDSQAAGSFTQSAAVAAPTAKTSSTRVSSATSYPVRVAQAPFVNVPLSTVPAMPGERVPAGYIYVRVPGDWPTGPEGVLDLACQGPTGMSLNFRARPGDVFMCPAGGHLVQSPASGEPP